MIREPLITLKEVPYDWKNEEAVNYCDVGAEKNFEIIINRFYTIGHLYIDFNYTTANGLECPVWLTWIEFLTIFRNKHLLKPVLDVIYDKFGEFYFESAMMINAKYHRVGAISCGMDEITELEIFKYSKGEKK